MKIGRNEPCPCGSGKKYKQCCLGVDALLAPIASECRPEAFQKLDAFCHKYLAKEMQDAHCEFWGEAVDRLQELEQDTIFLGQQAFEMWFCFDWLDEHDQTPVSRFLKSKPKLSPDALRFLLLCAESYVGLYCVLESTPGISLKLRDAFDESNEITVAEKRGSRDIVPGMVLAARILPTGSAGQPNIEAGLLHIPDLAVRPLMAHIDQMRCRFREEFPGVPEKLFLKIPALEYSQAWISCTLDPIIPDLANTDGEPILITSTHFKVLDQARLETALARVSEFELCPEEEVWHWAGEAKDGTKVALGQFKIKGKSLMLETNSAARATRGRALIERAAGDAVEFTLSSHQDIKSILRESRQGKFGKRSKTSAVGQEEIPRDVQERLTLDYLSRHYRSWLDEPLPALNEKTPRAAARDPELRMKLDDLIHQLEGSYLTSLRNGEPAYDPTWMWADLELIPAQSHPPMLAHERWAQSLPGWAESYQDFLLRGRDAARRQQTFADKIATPAELAAELSVCRFFKAMEAKRNEEENADGMVAALPARDQIERMLHFVVNYELQLRKTFWVDEALSFMLSQTDISVFGRDFCLPFPCFALVFTDRYILGLTERLLAFEEKTHPLAGHLLKVITLYVMATESESGRTLHLGFALDALGADMPHLLSRELVIRNDELLSLNSSAEEQPPGSTNDTSIGVIKSDGEALDIPESKPYAEILRVALNVILYATSSGIKPEARKPVAPTMDASDPSGQQPPFSSEEVYFLPGHIEISQVRKMLELKRTQSGGALVHRFMVRGHWRRPAKSWNEQRPIWIRPHWKGPDLAAIVERTYKLT